MIKIIPYLIGYVLPGAILIVAAILYFKRDKSKSTENGKGE